MIRNIQNGADQTARTGQAGQTVRPGQAARSGKTGNGTRSGADFGALLQRQMRDRQTSRTDLAPSQMNQSGTGQTDRQTVNFSKHALARAEERGIELTDTLLTKLADSVERAQEKGAKNILAFDNTRAFIINIPYSRVITAISQEEMRENIFTNIDGAVLL